MAEIKSTKVVTSEVRFSYLHAFVPSSVEEGGVKKYSASLLIPKNTKEGKKTIAAIEAVVEFLKEEFKTKNKGKLPANFKTPLRDGDEERGDDPNYEDCMFVNASSLQKPGVVDADLNPIMDADEFYSGCYGNASLNFYLFDKSGNRGIACGLNNLRKTKDGDNLGGGRSNAADDFASLTDLMD